MLAAIFTIAAFAQSQATSVSYNKNTTPALSLVVPYSEEITEGTIVQKLKEIGYDPETKGALFWKKNTIDGYYVFKDVALRNLNGETVDLYFKVNQKSRKDKDESNVIMMVGRGDRFYSYESDPTIFESAAQFLDGFLAHSATYKLNVDISAQEGSVKNAEGKYERLQDEEKSLSKRIKELEEDLRKNRENQESQRKVIESEKQKLEGLRTQSSSARNR